MYEYKLLPLGSSWIHAEDRLNLFAQDGWRVIAVVHDTGNWAALLERQKEPQASNQGPYLASVLDVVDRR